MLSNSQPSGAPLGCDHGSFIVKRVRPLGKARIISSIPGETSQFSKARSFRPVFVKVGFRVKAYGSKYSMVAP